MIIKTNTETYNGTVNFIGANLIELTFDNDAPLVFTEFSIMTERGKEIPVRGYTTLYNVTENGFILSNDGSVYEEPEEIEEEPVEMDPIVYEPTAEDRINDLEIAICELFEMVEALA